MAQRFMNKLKVTNFGPIGIGYQDEDGYMTFSQIVVFCGTQGTGKSTVAKLYSTFVWIEKALMRGDVSVAYITKYNRFANKYLSYQGIHNYIQEDSFIHFKGQCYDFLYQSGQFSVSDHGNRIEYERPQVIYIPAERNLLSVLDKTANNVKGMPDALAEMLDEYRQACQSLTDDITLPVNNVRFHYDSLNQIGSIISPDYRVRISEASSGLQSVSPMIVTLQHLYDITVAGKTDNKPKTTKKEQELIDKRVQDVLLDDTLSEETRRALVKKLYDNKNKRMVSIIEEPEQNLYPESQELLLYRLLKLSGTGNGQLLLTTHSPYILNYLSLAIKANEVFRTVNNPDSLEALCSIVPKEAMIDGCHLKVYQLELDGSISLLPSSYADMPTDDNKLNNQLMRANEQYANMVEIEMSHE